MAKKVRVYPVDGRRREYAAHKFMSIVGTPDGTRVTIRRVGKEPLVLLVKNDLKDLLAEVQSYYE